MTLLSCERLRVAHLIETDGPGGAERIVAQLAAALQTAGAANVAFLPAGGERWLTRQLEEAGVTVEHFHLQRPASPAQVVRSLTRALQRHRITLAHSHEFSMAVYGAAASWRAGVPHVITMHGGRYYAGRLRRRLALRAAVAVSARTVAVSHPLAQAMRRDLLMSESRVEMIPNGVCPVAPERAKVRQELGLTDDDCLLVAVGNLYPVKGHQHLLDAVARLAPRHPHVHIAIGGRGDLADQLTARAQGQGLGGRLHLLGLRSDIGAVLGAADMFVLPSLSEGLPLALLEAMFAGCPIIASDVGEVAATLGHGDGGIVVPSGDAAALASAIEGLLANPARAQELGRRALRRAQVEYHVSQMVRRYVDVYRESLSSRGSGVPGVRLRQARPVDAEGSAMTGVHTRLEEL